MGKPYVRIIRSISGALLLLNQILNITASSPNSTVSPTSSATASDGTTSSQLPSCKQHQIKFMYTECDIKNGRWRVAVPSKPGICTLKDPPKPERGRECSFSCPEGQYLDIKSQRCRKCKAGTYSLSGGIRFRSWHTLPAGFLNWGSNPDADENSKTEQAKCNSTIWSTKGDYIESAGDYCKSVLAYSVTLEKDGNISVVYRADDEDAFFHVKVVNNFCTTSHGGKHHFNLSPEWRWKRTYIPLQRGRNVIFIEASFIYESMDGSHDDGVMSVRPSDSSFKKSTSRTVQIREVKITGLSYTSECSKCEAGTYSAEGASFCRKCDENTYSNEGAASCTKCAKDEYSAKGAVSCTKRPKCSQKDFYEMWTDCDLKGKTRKSFFWVIPKICEGGQELPPPAQEMDCPPCNPGQFKNGTECAYCASGKYSDGKNDCKSCPPSTSPEVGFFLRWWQHIPKDLFHFYCFSTNERSCKSKNGWRTFSTFMDTGIGHADDTEVGLMLKVPEFNSDSSVFVLEYEMLCKSSCTFSIETRQEIFGKSTILNQHGRQGKTKFMHHIHGNDGLSFRFRFLKTEGDPDNDFDYAEDRLKIYALNITNAVNGGAAQCKECPLGVGSQGNGCVQCEKGSYLENKKCIKCPSGTYLGTTSSLGKSACKQCSIGTKSSKGSTRCYSDCHLHSNDGRHFDFSSLAGHMLRQNGKMFTSHGYPYFRMFNVTVCGKENSMSNCMNNFTKSTKDKEKDDNNDGVKAMVCRSTVIPHDNKENIIAQSMSLGDYLESITFGNPYEKVSVENNTKTDDKKTRGHRIRRDENLVNDTLPTDVNFHFKSKQSNTRCSDGYATIVTLRCDPTAAKKGYITTSPACPTGTCDGCLYHLFWHTENACPLCTYSDFQNITSACINGKVTTHYVWNFPRMCRDGVRLPQSINRNCSVLERTVLDLKIFIIVFIVMGLLLVLLIIILCYRNRKLNYKYSRLIDEAHYKDGELPASEKCTLEEGEEEDEIILERRSGGNGRRILDRLKKIGSPKNRDDFPEFETINLTERVRSNSSGDEI